MFVRGRGGVVCLLTENQDTSRVLGSPIELNIAGRLPLGKHA